MTTHAARRKRLRRRRLVVALVLILAFTIAAITGTLWRRSERSEQQAREEALRAEAAKLLALAQLELDKNHTAALAWATASLELRDTLEARRFAVEALWRGPTLFELSIDHDTPYELQDVAFSPDGRWMAASGSMDDVYVWPETGGEPVVLSRQGQFQDFGFGPNSDVLLVENEGGVIQHWSVPDWKVVRELDLSQGVPAEENAYHFFAVRNDRLLTFTERGENWWVRSWPFTWGEATDLGLWSREWATDWAVDPTGTWMAFTRGRELYRRPLETLESSKNDLLLGRHESNIYAFDISSDGNGIAASDESGEMIVWSGDPDPEHPLQTLRGPEAPFSVQFDPSASKLVTKRGVVNTIRISDLAGPPDARPLELHRGDWSGFYQSTFHPSGRWLAVPAIESLFLWPLDRQQPRILEGHTEEVGSLVFVGDGRQIATGTTGGVTGTVRLWPLSAERGGQGHIIWQQGLAVFALAADTEGERLLISNQFLGAYLLGLGKDPAAAENLWPEDAGGMSAVAFSPDGRRAAVSTFFAVDDQKMVIRVRDLESGDEQLLPLRDGASDGEPWEGGVDSLQFTPDDHLLSSGHGGARIWDLETETAEWLVTVPEETLMSMSVSRNGRLLLTIERSKWMTEGSRLTLHDLELGTSRAITSHGDRIQSLALDHTGSIVVSADHEGVIRVGPADGSEPHLLFGHKGIVYAIAVSPDGRWIASGGNDRTVRLWPMPDLSQPPLHTLPHDKLIAKLHSLTNLRVVQDPNAPEGWKEEVGPFPGWKEVPTW